MDSGKPFKCEYPCCPMSFDRPFKLTQHLQRHFNVRPYKCSEPDCPKAYSSKAHLDRHIQNVHQGKDYVIFSCPICIQTFSNRQNVKRHMATVHSEEREQISCTICNEHFKKKHQLSTHMYRHTGIKAFKCDVCDESFITLLSKRRHMRYHKTYECTQCYLVFNHWSQIVKHRKTEHVQKREYICDHCEKKFNDRSNMVQHLKKHYSQPPAIVRMFLCPFEDCGREYTRKSNLRQHIRMRHEEVKFICTICDAKLCTKSTLQKHMKLHDRTEPLVVKAKTKATGRKERIDKGSFRPPTAVKMGDLNLDALAKANLILQRIQKQQEEARKAKKLDILPMMQQDVKDVILELKTEMTES